MTNKPTVEVGSEATTHQTEDFCLADNLPEDNKINSYIWYHEYDYEFKNPILVIQGSRESIGFKLNPDDLSDLERTCICSAHSDGECCCGYRLEKDDCND